MNLSLLMVTVKNLLTTRRILVSVALVVIFSSSSLLLNLFLNKMQFLLIFASSNLSGLYCLANALHYLSKISWDVSIGK